MRSLKIPVVLIFAIVLSCAIGVFDQAQALLADHDCSFCHDFHGNPGYSGLLIAENSELVCLSCHSVSINDTDAAEVHNPNNRASNESGYITCRECHDAHDNQGGNAKMVGYQRDAQNWSSSFTIPGIRKEVTNTVGLTYNVVTFTGSTDFYIANSAQLGPCEVCHSPNHNAGQDCTACHGHSGGFLPSAGACTSCHDGTDPSAPVITDASPHAGDDTGYSCSACHSGHDAGTINVPNNPAVGINYNSPGHNGISLGSGTVTGATEAEICWNCHASHGVSEWGLNTDTNGGSFPNYNTGSLSGIIAPAWVNSLGTTGAIWDSANFSYKQGNIQSTHSVNEANGVSGKDAVTNIRCSYCHDVHDTYGPNTGSGPYLRGSWVGNPYREDGAPRNDASPSLPGDAANYSAYDVAGKFGAVPRGDTTYNALGGYFIDQNSGNPTNNAIMDSPDKFAGLCVLCHEGGNANGSWSSSEIDSINKFGIASNDWIGTNGHAAVVKGGGSSVAVNLFTMAKRFPTTTWAAYTGNGSQKGAPLMAYHNALSYDSKKAVWGTGYWAQGLRGTDGTAYQFSPRVDTSTRQYNYGNYNWGATVVQKNTDGTMSESSTDSSFHQFTCSKCHNPHASRLPRLLVTNCLDTNHNTWDDTLTTSNDAALAVENRNITLSQATSAQNCHRLADQNYPQAGPQGTTTGGWNKITPWNEFL